MICLKKNSTPLYAKIVFSLLLASSAIEGHCEDQILSELQIEKVATLETASTFDNSSEISQQLPDLAESNSIINTPSLNEEAPVAAETAPVVDQSSESISQKFEPALSTESSLVLDNTSDKQPAFQTEDRKVTKQTFKATAPALEGKIGYFFFLDSEMQDVYDQGGLDVQLAGAFPIWEAEYLGLQVYGSVEYLQRNGKSLNGHQKTSIYQVPVNLGLRPIFQICKEIDYYFTFGPRYFYIHQHNHSSYVEKDQGKSGIGFFANTGFNLRPTEHFLIDVFGEYSYGKIHFHHTSDSYSSSTQIGGLTFGLGIGYAF